MEDARCKLCGNKIADFVGMWCFGCKAFICENHFNDPWGSHKPEAHDDVGDEEDE